MIIKYNRKIQVGKTTGTNSQNDNTKHQVLDNI